MTSAGRWLLENVVIVPLDGPPTAPLGDVRFGAIRLDGDRIVAVGQLPRTTGERVVDGRGATVTPGFVQGHVHATQTLFRGLADDRPLLPWLQDRIWPLEHAHDADSTRLSADLTFGELLRSGTTTVQTMESVRHAEVTAAVARDSGMTVITGNCLMDVAAPGMPAGMATSASAALQITDELRRAFDGQGNGATRLRVCVAPRFVLSVSPELARDAAGIAAQHDLRIHSHAAEHPDEVAAVRERFGRDYLEVLAEQGLLGARTGLAHCVHLTDRERELLAATGTAVLHCPSTNLKLGSGIARVRDLAEHGIPIAIGADGAPCNNRLSMLTELRQAALLQSLVAGPGAWPAARALWTATRGGALALGLDDTGSIAPGQRADLLLWDLDDPTLGSGDVASRLVYAADERHLQTVFVGGRPAALPDFTELARERDRHVPALLARAGIAR